MKWGCNINTQKERRVVILFYIIIIKPKSLKENKALIFDAPCVKGKGDTTWN